MRLKEKQPSRKLPKLLPMKAEKTSSIQQLINEKIVIPGYNN
jgi:hypothetical protein